MARACAGAHAVLLLLQLLMPSQRYHTAAPSSCAARPGAAHVRVHAHLHVQLPKSLGLTLLPRQPGGDGSGCSSPQQQQEQQQGQQGQEVDLDMLAEAMPSRLLVSLLGAAASPDAVGAAAGVLSWLDASAAAKNDFLSLFRSRQEFPEVCAGLFDTCVLCVCTASVVRCCCPC